jgi:hypothetical protein
MERNLTVKNTLRYIVDNHEIQNPYIIVPRRFFFFFFVWGGWGRRREKNVQSYWPSHEYKDPYAAYYSFT